jgi:hypothetical protein
MLKESLMHCWVNQDALFDDEQVETKVREAWEHEGSKDEMNVLLQGLEQHSWKGTEAGWMGCYYFPGETWAGDGSANKGIMGAGTICFQQPGCNLVVRVGREEEGVSSLRQELAVIARTLQATSVEVDLLYLCDSESSLNKVSRWIGSGPRTMVESVLFIGTQFSNLYTAVDTPARGRVGSLVIQTQIS